MPQDYLLMNRCDRCQAQDIYSRFKYYRCSQCGTTVFLCESCSQNLVCDNCKASLIELEDTAKKSEQGFRGCLISPEESLRIAREEGITLRKPQQITPEQRKIIEERIISSLPTEHGEEMRKTLEAIHSELDETSSLELNSKSYIVVTCEEDANPKLNRLQLRTDPPTYIELNPGKNVLTVEKYPDLKYGFSQIDDYVFPDDCEELQDSEYWYEYNGGQIIEIDLSHFDGSEMTSMDCMFLAFGPERIIFGNLNTSQVISMKSAFADLKIGDNSIEIIDISNLDLSKVENVSDLFSGARIKELKLPKFPAVNQSEDMFMGMHIDKIIFNEIGEYGILDIVEELGNSEDEVEITFKGARELKQIQSIIQTLEYFNLDYKRISYNFGSKIKFRTAADDNENITSLVAVVCHEEKRALKLYDIKGTKIVSIRDPKIKIAYIPNGIKIIGESAFKGCSELTTVILPETIERIERYAFIGCENLRFITFPEKLNSIGEGVFHGCERLNRLYIPDNVVSCSWFGDVKLDYLRLPFRIFHNLSSEILDVKNLVVALPYQLNDFDINCWGEFFDGTNIILEPYEAAGDGNDINGFKIVNGMVMCDTKEKDEIEGLWSIMGIPDYITAIPNGVERICDCGHDIGVIYIPSTVCDINEGAFQRVGPRPIFVTKKENLENLMNLLPIDIHYTTIHTV